MITADCSTDMQIKLWFHGVLNRSFQYSQRAHNISELIHANYFPVTFEVDLYND